MPNVRVRVTAGVGAWAFGAATATGLSLFAVSYLGQGVADAQGAPMSPAQVNQQLDALTGTPTPTSTAEAAGPTPTDSARPDAVVAPTTAMAPAMSATNAPSSSPSASPTSQRPVERRFSDSAGGVIAQCQGSQAYLLFWSPAQGFEVGFVQRGPARVATVMFTDGVRHEEMRIVCSGGVPQEISDDASGGDT